MKLKQKIAMALCAFYLVSVIGIAISMHFCSGKLSSVKFTETAKCAACKDESKLTKKHDCCENTAVDAKIKDSHETGFKVKLPQNFSIELFISSIFADIFRPVLPGLFNHLANKAPPLSSILSLHIFNCVFRN